MKRLFVLILIVFLTAAAAAPAFSAENAENTFESFYETLNKFTYDEINRKFIKSTILSETYDENLNSVIPEICYEYPNGVLSGMSDDFDGDGDAELAVFSLQSGVKGEYSQREQTNAIDITLYELEGKKVVKTAEIRGMEHIFAEGSGGARCFVKTAGDQKYICIQFTNDYYLTGDIMDKVQPNQDHSMAKVYVNIFKYSENSLERVCSYYSFGHNFNIRVNPNPYNSEEKLRALGFEKTYEAIKNHTIQDFESFNITVLEPDVTKVYEITTANNAASVYFEKNNERIRCGADYVIIKYGLITTKFKDYSNL